MSKSPLDIRVAAVGDSFVHGTNDPQRLGWVGRLPLLPPHELTVYNLGIRRDTSTDIAQRWAAETQSRLNNGDAHGVAFSFGANDTMKIDGYTRVSQHQTLRNLTGILEGAHSADITALILGPPPLADPEHSERIGNLDQAMAEVSQSSGVTYVSVFDQLYRSEVWMQQVAENDGAHPSSEGYECYAGLVSEAWLGWLATEVVQQSPEQQ
jgi:lysophospholipase L1-like esterase